MSSIPLALIQALTRQKQPRVGVGALPDAPPVHVDDDLAMEQYGARTQPGVAGNMMYREGVNDSRAVPVGAPDPLLRLATRPRRAEEVPVAEMPPIEPRVIEPESVDAPNLSFRPDDRRVRIDEGLRSADPGRVRDAMESRRELAANAPRGFLGKVGRVLKGVGEGAVQGAARGGGAGMILGALAGGISPRYADQLSDEVEFARRYPENVQGENIRYRNAELERRTAAEQRQQANYDRQARATEAQIRNQEADNAFQRDQFNFNKTKEQRLVDEQARDNKRAEDQQLFNRRESLTKDGGLPMPTLGEAWFSPEKRAEAKANPNRGNFIPVTESERYRMPSAAQQDARKTQQVTNESRARGAAELEKRIQMLPIELREYGEKERIKASFDTERDRIDLAGVPTVTQFENAKAEAKELATRASAARTAKDPVADKLQAQADEAYGRAEAFHSAMIESGGYDDNSSGGWVGVKRKPMTRKGGVIGGKSRASTSSPSRGKAQRVISKATYDEMVKDAAAGDKDAVAALEAIKAGRYTVK